MSCAIQCYAVTPAVYHLFYVEPCFVLPSVALEIIHSSIPTFFNWNVDLKGNGALKRITVIEPGDVGRLWAWKEKSALLSVVANRLYCEGEHLGDESFAGDMVRVSIADTGHHARQNLLTPEYYIVLYEHWPQKYIFDPLVLQAFFTELVRWRNVSVQHEEYLNGIKNMLPYLMFMHGQDPEADILQ